MIDTAVAPVAAPPRRRHRGRWVAAATVAVLAVAGVTAWLVVGLTPRLGNGSTAATDPEAIAKPDVFVYGPDEQVVVDPADGSLDGEWSFRNDGPATIVVSAAPQAQAYVTYDIQLRLIPPHGGSSIADADVVTVGPGEEFGVRYSWAPGCASFGPGTGESTDSVRLRVDTLGITRTVDVVTDHPLTYWTETGYTPPASCAS
ncbi:hypothetical protein [Cellulomonas rhizosphaerae]|uniref:Uncharacterized protein n=1 Tax=Cellulomonas rhizosphaerae TaxID=2293719 RepID=A0A413RJC0_9CELL|nr:hypothetical protein [Cellulomonas rhizosphaerae]RHA38586.1 hypothetical protein D1825_13590 [Cellulomonas rhizosphaerae]